MDELRKYYNSRFITLAISVVLLGIAITVYENKFGIDSLWAKILTSRPALLVILALGSTLINKWLWRVEHPELDFMGEWEGETTYSTVHIGSAPDNLPFTSKHELLIDQDCSHFSIAPTNSNDYLNWGSLAANLQDKNTIQYAYWVNYKTHVLFPDEAKGYEELKVTKRDTNNRPMELTGKFHHCVEGQKPVYSGTVKFQRK